MKKWVGIWVLSIVVLGWPVYELSRPAPRLFAIYQGSTPINMTSSLQLEWDQEPSADSFTIKRSLVHLGPYTTIATGITTNLYVDSTVKPKTTYYYVISATNSIGTSSDSSEAQGTTP